MSAIEIFLLVLFGVGVLEHGLFWFGMIGMSKSLDKYSNAIPENDTESLYWLNKIDDDLENVKEMYKTLRSTGNSVEYSFIKVLEDTLEVILENINEHRQHNCKYIGRNNANNDY